MIEAKADVAADPAVAEKDEPVFAFQVYADATDSTGETRSANRAVRAGYTALQAALAAQEWQTPDKPVALTVTTESFDGEPQAAAGTVKVYRLKQPDRVQRAAMKTWQGELPLQANLAAEPEIASRLPEEEIARLCSLDIHFAHVDDTFRKLGLSGDA